MVGCEQILNVPYIQADKNRWLLLWTPMLNAIAMYKLLCAARTMRRAYDASLPGHLYARLNIR